MYEKFTCEYKHQGAANSSELESYFYFYQGAHKNKVQFQSMNLSYQISMVMIHSNISITSIHDVSCSKLSRIFLKSKREWWK